MFYFLLISTQLVIEFFKCQKLIFAEIHFRNGARAPLLLDNESKDYFKEKWDNPGELTGSGERMHYLLGFRNRLRYITDKYHFLSEKYDAHELLILSTPSNYTLVSASSHLQGLYPMDYGIGEYLTKEQQESAIPGVDISAQEIQEEIENLDNCSLPNSMTVIPVHMLHKLEKRMILFLNEGCINKTESNKKKNLEEINEIKNEIKNFNENYGKKLNLFYGLPENNFFDFNWMNDFCECLKADYIDNREFEEFNSSKLDKNKLEEDCSRIREKNLKFYLFGDKNGEIATMEASKIMREMIDFMKFRIDADINNEKIEEKYEDFSRPKMVLLSSEDSSLAAHQIFLIKIFGLGMDYYRHPEYADQLSYEVTRPEKKEQSTQLSYIDYNVTYYFNDDIILNVNFKEFMNTILKNSWAEEKIDSYCFINNPATKTNILLIVIITWSGLVFILIIISIVLCYKVHKKRNSLKEELEGFSEN